MAPDGARFSVSSLEDAQRWLWTFARVEDWLFLDGPLPPVAALVCDMFWLSQGQLRDRLMRDWREVNPSPRFAPPRRRYAAGWRS